MDKEKRLAEIKARIEKLDADRKVLEKSWAEDVKVTVDKPKFDPFSKRGGKILRKVADKYTPMFVDIDDERQELVEEYNKIIDEIKK